MSNIHDDMLEAMKDSLAAALPNRLVQRGLPVDPAAERAERLALGLVCVVGDGGGNFANWAGREGEIGDMGVKLVCLCKVEPKAPRVDVEQLELAILADLLAWVQAIKAEPLDDVIPSNWTQSKQMEHPFGWLVLDLTVRHV